MQNHRLSRAAVLLFLVLLPSAAGASPISWQLNGKVTASTPIEGLDGLLPVGTDVTFFITVDPAAPDRCDSAWSGLYVLPGITMSFGGQSHSTEITYFEVNAPDGSCLSSPAETGLALRSFGFAQLPLSSITIYTNFSDPGGALPTTPGLGQFYASIVGHSDQDVSGVITGSAVVPEPSTFLLFVSGIAAIAARRGRRAR